ncbi:MULTISPECIES: alpha/beta hydrolase [unclassified Methylobacterium]|uniref:alpha/beta hydrolase n=1 Tax=unclassified Methylobacterium TaxID=2615210 RepID=UPI0008A8149B|nr:MULTISPECIES: alpha/beta hydrolase [unclassified Methylobacterium]SEH38270.1 Acetyl esterase/lipase [Methylobacterium sp. 275MFSha3.1]SFD75900.1 Acetyl esterase/lipase [Methylobacterium sp. 13MFTsu3.1M2]
MASLRAYLGAYMVRSRVRGPLSRARDAAAFRRIFEAPTFPDPKGVTYEPGIVGGVKGEWVRPKAGPGRRMLYIHGGGFIACSPRTHRPVTGALANRGFTIFAPEYRLAPEHPFPAAVDDVTAVWAAFSAEGAACVAGESAGGNLALVLMGEARARGLPMPWAAALFSPATDFMSEDGSRVTNAWRDAMFDPQALAAIRPMYLGAADPADPRVSPLYGDPTGFPPLLFHVGAREVLRDDSVRMAERARRAGVETELKLFPVVSHAWQFAASMLPEARTSLDEAAAFLTAHAPHAPSGSTQR